MGTGVVGQNGPCQTAKTLSKTCVKTDGFVGFDVHVRRTQIYADEPFEANIKKSIR